MSFNFARLDDLGFHPHLFGQLLQVIEMEDHTDGSHNRPRIGHNTVRRRRDVVSPGSGHILKRRDHLFPFLLKGANRIMNFLNRGHGPARRIDSQDHRFHVLVLAQFTQASQNASG
jgi:hypothetical protein